MGAAVSVIMATYNGEKYVGEQIESILKSTEQDFEIFIYDDGSKDHTMSLLEQYQKSNLQKLHVTKNEKNLGVTVNFLQAACRADSDYIMFCDQDDVWKPGKIEVTLKRMKRMEESYGKTTPLAVFTDAAVADEHLHVIQPSFFHSGKLDPGKSDLSHLLMENKLIGCTVMVNAALQKILKGHRLPKQARFHDWWIALTAASFGKISFINESTMLYRQHGNNVVGNQSFFSYVINRISSIKRQKEALLALEKQADEFGTLYKEHLSGENRKLIHAFATLNQVNFIMRRYRIIRYRYYKTGIIRNIGVMFLA